MEPVTMYIRTYITRGGHCTGFTLVELIMSLAITSMIGLGVSTLLLSMSSATRSQNDLHAQIVRRHILALRIGGMIKSSAYVLDVRSESLILWMGDYDNNGRPNISEIGRLQWNNDGEIWFFESPETLDPALDLSYELDAEFYDLTTLWMGTGLFPGQLNAEEVSGCKFEAAIPEINAGQVVRVLVTTDDGASVIVSTPRNQTN